MNKLLNTHPIADLIANEVATMFKQERSYVGFIGKNSRAERLRSTPVPNPALTPTHRQKLHPPVMREFQKTDDQGVTRRYRRYSFA